MEKMVDKIKDGEEAMEYWDRCRMGIVGTIEDLLRGLNEINERTEEEDTRVRVERMIRKLEAQLNK